MLQNKIVSQNLTEWSTLCSKILSLTVTVTDTVTMTDTMTVTLKVTEKETETVQWQETETVAGDRESEKFNKCDRGRYSDSDKGQRQRQ